MPPSLTDALATMESAVAAARTAGADVLTASQARDVRAAAAVLSGSMLEDTHAFTKAAKAVLEPDAEADALAVEDARQFILSARKSISRKAAAGSVFAQAYGEGSPADGSPRPTGAWGAAVVRQLRESAPAGIKAVLGPAGSVSIPVPTGQPATQPYLARHLRELIPTEDAPGGVFSYLRATLRDSAAAVVARGAEKPTSTYGLTRIDGTTSVVAHLSEPISRVDIDDDARLGQFIDLEMRRGLDLALDGEIVAAIQAAGPLVEGYIASSSLTTVRRAITRLQERDVAPTALAIGPRDWEALEQEAVTTFAANDNIVAPVEASPRRVWGVPVLVSSAMLPGQAILGDFATSAALYQTGDVRLDWTEAMAGEDGVTDFAKNLVRFRAEGRWGPAILRAYAFVVVALDDSGS